MLVQLCSCDQKRMNRCTSLLPIAEQPDRLPVTPKKAGAVVPAVKGGKCCLCSSRTIRSGGRRKLFMTLLVMEGAKPHDLERPRVILMMSVNTDYRSANLAWLSSQFVRLDREEDGFVRRVFCGISFHPSAVVFRLARPFHKRRNAFLITRDTDRLKPLLSSIVSILSELPRSAAHGARLTSSGVSRNSVGGGH